jgi:CheY-like chemotaxis protein
MSTVLIIEDDHNLLEGLEIFLSMEGYDTLATTNGRTALDMIHRHQPDVVVTNYQMPGADGFDVLRAIRGEPDLTHTRVVFITADHTPAVRQRALSNGADAYLTKPFRSEELAEMIAQLLEEERELL